MAAAGTATYGAAASEHPEAVHAVAEAAGAVLEQVGPAADVAAVFVTPPHIEAIDDIAAACRAILSPGTLIGATAVGVIGGPEEIEEVPAVSVWAGHTGPAEPVRLEVLRGADGAVVAGMPEQAGIGRRTLVLLADPHRFPAEALVRATTAQYPDLVVVGGLASAGGPGVDRLVLDDAVHEGGAVGVLLPEAIGETAVVAQGCRPVGDPFIVTASEGNLVLELGSRPAVERLRVLLEEASEADRELLTRGLHVGLVIDESAAEFDRGDFLIRAVLGAEPDTGGLRVGDQVKVGTTLQFHVRDAEAADDDLRTLLHGVEADAALVFTCNGRGVRLFGEPDHDAALVSEAVAGGPVAGMFCAGEIGPVRGHNHVHGFTAATLFLYG